MYNYSTKFQYEHTQTHTHTHTNHSALPQERVKLLKDCYNYKYAYPIEKSEKVWSGIKNAVNNKGRNQKRL